MTVSCYRCNKERPDSSKSFNKKKLGTEIGKTAAEKSRGLFNADDWQCNKCANVNWARRQTCNVCNAPKYGEVEARTGYGGGYNERGVVEYRRREPSSDDEYDEFGRKKRKRKPDSQEKEKVGITEGAVCKKLPPTVLQKESNKEHTKSVLGPKFFMNTVHSNDKRNGTLSDNSKCELSSLPNVAVTKYQQISTPTQGINKFSSHKTNTSLSRKRSISSGDRDHTASSGYDTGSKRTKRDTTDSMQKKLCNPVMENSVSSTKNELACKFTKDKAAGSIQVTYTLEEKVRCAALAIVYNNCKITTDKFEALYPKPAPDFETIFAWRHKLMTTGCLIDSHSEINFEQCSKNVSDIIAPRANIVSRLPNPDEIIIPSESDEEEPSKHLEKTERSMSAETLLISTNRDLQAPGSSASTVDGRGSRGRSYSQSTHHRTRSNSRESQDSNYPDTDSEKGPKSDTPRHNTKSINLPTRQSIHDSDSESVSYNSEEDNFLSRVFGQDRKRRKLKKPVVAPTPKFNDYTANNANTFEGYSTIKSMEQSPLVTGNIYTNNLRNMNVKTRENLDMDACSSEYVPTKLGSTAKKNYQEFKDNVRRKGFWAKGNGASLAINRHNMSIDIIHQTAPKKLQEEMVKSQEVNQYAATVQIKPLKKRTYEFSNDENDVYSKPEHFLPLEEPKQAVTKQNNFEDTSRIFAQVESNSVSKNKSILDIFDISDPALRSPQDDLESSENVRKIYENRWDEDDEALYKISDCDEQAQPSQELSPITSHRGQSPISNMLYTTESNTIPKSAGGNSTLISDFITDKHEMLMEMLKDLQNKDLGKMVSPLKHGTPRPPSAEDINVYPKTKSDTNIPMIEVEVLPNISMANNINVSNLLMTRPDLCLTNKMTKSDQSIISTRERSESGLNHIIKRSDTIHNFSSNRHPIEGESPKPRENNDMNKVCNVTKNRPDAMQSNPKLDHVENPCLSEVSQNVPTARVDTVSNQPVPDIDRASDYTTIRSDLNPILTMKLPEPISKELSNEVMRLSEENVVFGASKNVSKIISPSKRVHILENVRIRPGSPHPKILHQQNTTEPESPKSNKAPLLANAQLITSSPDTSQEEGTLEKSVENASSTAQVDFTNLLANINTNTLLLALQNLQKIGQSTTSSLPNEQVSAEQPSPVKEIQVSETINLTNDEDWEKESNRDGSIERQLEKLDGNTGDTPFLSDIFDPGPVIIPPNIVKKLNLGIENVNETNNSNENAPVIGNFKSFALPKPIMLNRLKLTVKTADKTSKNAGKRKSKNKSKSLPVSEQADADEEEDEESGDEADLSKYDLWGSDAEQGNSSKAETEEKMKVDGASKESGPSSQNDKDGKTSPHKSLGVPPPHQARLRAPVLVTAPQLLKISYATLTKYYIVMLCIFDRFDDFNLNSERESSPKGRKSRSRSRSPRSRASSRRKSRDSRSAGETRSHESSRDKEYTRDRDRRDRSRGNREDRKERRYSREGGNHYNSRGRHR
ncbi:hypothetical protein HW555_010072 [Spodoptera exigua]|uniref:RanBP2-type domain-containing protein n=1 Tax=Spodoptera exigua TaxID=7107 RepID=A0A835GBT7_SPOEX|nr:hypothetical protein HW555_010072 [Spodoptera exigua]